ncbi:MAG TPA: diacylglycerol kinase family protein [Verrucomicrobiae bacterium]|nr:diacylglycerol kinase family protein [Verrucomicrobiae bacterium]
MSPDSPQPASPAAPARTGAPLFILLNPRAGSSDKDEARDTVTALLDAAQHPYELHAPEPGEDLEQACRRVAGLAARRGGVLVPAGGDGTINAAVNAARKQGVTLGLLPLGTFNYLAREHGIPLELDEAVRALMAGTPRPVAMGEVNGRLFFNNASFGLYTTLIHEREAAKERFGRHRIVAAAALIGSLLRGQPPFEIQIVTEGTVARRRTSLVFVGANEFQLTRLGLRETAERKGDGLAVVVLKPTSLLQRVRMMLRAALKQLDEDGRLDAFCTREFDVHSRRARIEVIVDGEAIHLAQPLRFRTIPAAVELIVPG